MNRIIKFRGKRVDKNEWVTGDVRFTPKSLLQKCIIYDKDKPLEYAVIPESVGQFTGLLDKNKVEIYEKCIINDKYRVDYKGYKYVLTDISNNDTLDILEVQKDENGLTITKEYSEV